MSLDIMLPRTSHKSCYNMPEPKLSKFKSIFSSRKASSAQNMTHPALRHASYTPADEPPAYSPIDLSPAAGSSTDARLGLLTLDDAHAPPGTLARSATASTSTTDNVDLDFSRLADFDTVFVIDDSGSMSLEDEVRSRHGATSVRPSRWRETQKVLAEIAPVCAQYDADGIDIHFLHHNYQPESPLEARQRVPRPLEYVGLASEPWRNVRTAAEVERIFARASPNGGTPLGRVLDRILQDYIHALRQARGDKKPMNVIVITDGQPDKPRDRSFRFFVDDVIARAAADLDALDAPGHQLGLQFIQVGKDHHATEFLDKLDNDLKERGVRDMVDTITFKDRHEKPLTRNGVLKAVLGGVEGDLDLEEQSSKHHT